ncbi:MAG: shikimate dehydrogenase [Proteobacteria bacterium]|nr:shikimate dehydrogenase [Pseudomonadota bacterium]
MKTVRVLSGKARVAGVMGWPVAHSRSPRLHGYWLAKYEIDGAYVPLAVRPENLAAALSALSKLGFAGVNVTVPHKETVAGLVDECNPTVLRIGAVNTVVIGSDGRVIGNNTDGYGFLENLRERAPSWRAGAGAAVLLGAGGAARAIAAALLDSGVPLVRIVNRTRARADELIRVLDGRLEAVDWEHRAKALEGAALLVNTTTLGMVGQPPLAIDLAALPRTAVVNDIVYVPLETPLLTAARARGYPVVDGLGMLLHQARPGFRAWFGRDPEVDQGLRDFILADLGA